MLKRAWWGLRRTLSRSYAPLPNDTEVLSSERLNEDAAPGPLLPPPTGHLLPPIKGTCGCGDLFCDKCEANPNPGADQRSGDEAARGVSCARGAFAIPHESLLEEEDPAEGRGAFSFAKCDIRSALLNGIGTCQVLVVHGLNNPPERRTLIICAILLIVPLAAAVLCLALSYFIWWLNAY